MRAQPDGAFEPPGTSDAILPPRSRLELLMARAAGRLDRFVLERFIRRHMLTSPRDGDELRQRLVRAREFYADHFLPQIPPDLEITSLTQTFGNDRLVEEMVVRFTHSLEMDWILPGLRPTRRTAEFVLAGVIQFEGGKVAHEHLYWDQATLLSQMGVLDHPLAVRGVDSARQLLRLR